VERDDQDRAERAFARVAVGGPEHAGKPAELE
jgi:hypothetical protein